MTPEEVFYACLNDVKKIAEENIQLAQYVDNLTKLSMNNNFSAGENEHISIALQTLKDVLVSRQKALAERCLDLDASRLDI